MPSMSPRSWRRLVRSDSRNLTSSRLVSLVLVRRGLSESTSSSAPELPGLPERKLRPLLRMGIFRSTAGVEARRGVARPLRAVVFLADLTVLVDLLAFAFVVPDVGFFRVVFFVVRFDVFFAEVARVDLARATGLAFDGVALDGVAFLVVFFDRVAGLPALACLEVALRFAADLVARLVVAVVVVVAGVRLLFFVVRDAVVDLDAGLVPRLRAVVLVVVFEALDVCLAGVRRDVLAVLATFTSHAMPTAPLGDRPARAKSASAVRDAALARCRTTSPTAFTSSHHPGQRPELRQSPGQVGEQYDLAGQSQAELTTAAAPRRRPLVIVRSFRERA